MSNRIALVFWASALALGCGDSTGDDTGGGSGDGATANPATSDTGSDPSATSNGTSAPGGGASSGGMDDTGGTTGNDGAETGAGIKLDLGGIPDSPNFCMEGDGEVEFSYIWVANSTQSTISKINTRTLVEEGRYYTRPDLNGNPSRTSVSLNGNVAVANRNGGLTKFYVNEENCHDTNGNGVINSSTGSADIKAWGSEECMAWYTPMVYTSQRPVAWTQGEWNQEQCATINEKVWTSGANGESIEVLFVDGETGVVEQTIPIPGVSAGYYGIYGAAVDSEGNFWGSQLGGGTLVNVDRQTFMVRTWPTPAGGYGMTVDQDGYVWTCSYQAGRFDPVTETWQQANVNGSGGCMADGGNILWMAANPMIGINRQTLAVEYSIPLPDYVHGVSVDVDGYVWGVSMNTSAYKVDPATGLYDTVTGLIGPYTYSDMTGFALSNVGGGGAPSG
ncbi:MAG: hypothetical protein KC501_31090 [Myxococcales bacterium]|nr:hypothetical protein [Myxococcales bacterium]